MGENQSNQQKQSRPDPAVADPDKDLVSTAGQGRGLGNQQSDSQQTGNQQSGQPGSQQQSSQQKDSQADQQRANR